MIDNESLYFVEVDGVARLLALDVNVAEESGKTRLTYFDTNRDRTFNGKVIEENPSGFTFVSEHKQTHPFRLATASEFDRDWRIGGIEGSAPNFNTDDELHAWYRKIFLGL